MGILLIPMLVGAELIEFVKENDTKSQKELAEYAGYVRTTKTGKTQVLTKSFINALLSAKGMPLQVGKAPGKVAKYQTTVHANGVVLIGKTYIDKFGLNPGDELDILIEDDCIRLVPMPYEEEQLPRVTPGRSFGESALASA